MDGNINPRILSPQARRALSDIENMLDATWRAILRRAERDGWVQEAIDLVRELLESYFSGTDDEIRELETRLATNLVQFTRWQFAVGSACRQQVTGLPGQSQTWFTEQYQRAMTPKEERTKLGARVPAAA